MSSIDDKVRPQLFLKDPSANLVYMRHVPQYLISNYTSSAQLWLSKAGDEAIALLWFLLGKEYILPSLSC